MVLRTLQIPTFMECLPTDRTQKSIFWKWVTFGSISAHFLQKLSLLSLTANISLSSSTAAALSRYLSPLFLFPPLSLNTYQSCFIQWEEKPLFLTLSYSVAKCSSYFYGKKFQKRSLLSPYLNLRFILTHSLFKLLQSVPSSLY